MATVLESRLREPRRFIQAVTGPRQVGKTTLVTQATERAGASVHFVSADSPTGQTPTWLEQQWEVARLKSTDGASVLVIDEIQKVRGWSEVVKRLWDEDTRGRTDLKVVILGSAPLLVSQGLTESLAGRFEQIHVPHWSYPEMSDAFGFDVAQFVLFGGYPGAATLIDSPTRWRRYILDSLVETTISRDLLLNTRVDKPALLRQLFSLACEYSGQVLSYNKMLGQLQDAGNATTLAHYLTLLQGAGMVTGLQKFSGSTVRTRGSSPKLQVFNTALMTAALPDDPEREILADPTVLGRHVESAVGAHLANAASSGKCELYYWRENNREVDFVVKVGRTLVAIEVKSGARRGGLPGIESFQRAHGSARPLLVGADGIGLEEFLSTPVGHWAT